MITITKKFFSISSADHSAKSGSIKRIPVDPMQLFSTYQSLIGCAASEVLFFDIETTGLSASNSMVFLIGAIYFDGKNWQLKQYLAENAVDEDCIIREFFALAAEHHTLIHFNGTTFDIPYLKERARAHAIPEPLSQMESLDLYQKFRPLKNLLQLPRMNQQSLEQFLEWTRQDQLTGKQMISLFQKYAASGEKLIADLLLLHNHDDLLGMAQLLQLFAYQKLYNGKIDQLRIDSSDIFSNAAVLDAPNSVHETEPLQPCGCLSIHFQLEQPLPAALELSCPAAACSDTAAAQPSLAHPAPEVSNTDSKEADMTFTTHPCAARCVLSVQNAQGCLSVPIFSGELKYFFPDYRHYYYLPAEDQAVHKSIGAYVDPAHRENAKPSTCYVKKAGLFLPQPEPIFEPAFYPEYHSKHIYFEYTESFGNNSEELAAYVQTLLKYLLSGFIRP